MCQVSRRWQYRLLALILLVSAMLSVVQHTAGASGHGVKAGQGSGDPPVASGRQEPANPCLVDEEPESDAWVCPATGDASYPYIETVFSDGGSNGIAITFTEGGLSHAASCEGAEALAMMVAQLYAQLPAPARAEESIEWAIPQMTGEINGHARLYRAATTAAVRNAANPVNIVFPEYRGEFPEGVNGLNAWAQQVYYGSLCR